MNINVSISEENLIRNFGKNNLYDNEMLYYTSFIDDIKNNINKSVETKILDSSISIEMNKKNQKIINIQFRITTNHTNPLGAIQDFGKKYSYCMLTMNMIN